MFRALTRRRPARPEAPPWPDIDIVFLDEAEGELDEVDTFIRRRIFRRRNRLKVNRYPSDSFPEMREPKLRQFQSMRPRPEMKQWTPRLAGRQ